MMRIQFDLEPKIEAKVLQARSEAALKHVHEGLLHTNSQDEFPAFQKLKSLCKREDYFDSGSITVGQMGNVLVQCGINEHPQVVRAIFDDFDTKGAKAVAISTFCEGVFGRTVIPKKVPGVPALMERVRGAILARGIQTMNRLVASFRIMDKDRSQSLSPEELFNGLRDFGVDLTQEECVSVVKAFDRSNDGAIDLTEFLVALRGTMNDRREELVGLAFKQLDKRGQGVVKFSELCKIYDASRHPEVKAGHATEEDIVKEFISGWDRNGDGNITVAEFVDYYKTLSCSIDNDDYFELMIRNAWHLAGGSGASANTSNLRVLVEHEDGSEAVVGLDSDLGINKNDQQALKAALRKQGVSTVKTVKLCM